MNLQKSYELRVEELDKEHAAGRMRPSEKRGTGRPSAS
jgi:hypothetical protein